MEPAEIAPIQGSGHAATTGRDQLSRLQSRQSRRLSAFATARMAGALAVASAEGRQGLARHFLDRVQMARKCVDIWPPQNQTRGRTPTATSVPRVPPATGTIRKRLVPVPFYCLSIAAAASTSLCFSWSCDRSGLRSKSILKILPVNAALTPYSSVTGDPLSQPTSNVSSSE